MADTCNAFASFTCAKNSNTVKIGGSGFNNSLPDTVVLGSNSFTVTVKGATLAAGDDLVIIAAAPNGLTGTINGMSFTPGTSSILEGGSSGAIAGTWAGLGITANNPQYGYVNLGAYSSLTGTIPFSGLGTGTVLYGVIVNSSGQIVAITANSEAGVNTTTTTTTPEPASLTLLGTGLAGLAGLVRRKLVKS